MRSLLGSRSAQVIFCILGVAILFVIFTPSRPNNGIRMRRLYHYKHESAAPSPITDQMQSSMSPSSSSGEIIDYSRCSPHQPLRIFVHPFNHPLAKDLAAHPTATKNQQKACLFIAFTNEVPSTLPSSWNSLEEPGLNHVLINLNGNVSICPKWREIIVQARWEEGAYRPLLDFSLSPDVPAFDNFAWQLRPGIMPLKRKIDCILVVDDEMRITSRIPQITCVRDCYQSLLSSSFCLLPRSHSFHTRLLSSLRAGCIPVTLSNSQTLPFQDHLDWRLASLRFPLIRIDFIPEILKELSKEDVIEMRRRGRVFLRRIDDADALAKSLVAALAERVYIGLPLHSETPSHLIAPNEKFSNKTSKSLRIPSKFGSQKVAASRMYSSARWNSGRDLTYTPRTLHDVPMMPGDAAFHEGTQENLGRFLYGGQQLGLTRDEEQFTAIILTYDRDEAVKEIIEKLRDCPFLNKVMIVWNNRERRPSGSWPEIHVPVEFILAEKNSLNSRFLPYDQIETEAVVSIDDDMDVGQPELMFGFRMWRENRDRVVGYPERFHRFKDGQPMYGLSLSCEHSMILTSFAFVHKEFLFEYSHNQHPAILAYVDKHRNCEDIAMNFLVSHLTRRPPLKVTKKTHWSTGTPSGLSSRGSHYRERDECIRMFSQVYGYNPLLFSQEVARPTWNCVKGL